MPNQDRPKSIRALERSPGAEYDEETFHHLLAMERARTERSSQRLRLLLVTLEPVPGKPVPIVPASAARLFESLRLSLRETDIVGWYRQDRVAGAVLSARADSPGFETSGLIEQRVGDGFRERLPSRVSRGLRVRVTEQGPRRLAKG
jgi:hypothetical protein